MLEAPVPEVTQRHGVNLSVWQVDHLVVRGYVLHTRTRLTRAGVSLSVPDASKLKVSPWFGTILHGFFRASPHGSVRP